MNVLPRDRLRLDSAAVLLSAVLCAALFVAGACSNIAPEQLLRSDFNNADAPQLVEDGAFYRLQSGDTIWQLARRYGIREESILAANDISDVRLLRPGMRLFLPGIVLPPGESDTGAQEPAKTDAIADDRPAPEPGSSKPAANTSMTTQPEASATKEPAPPPKPARAHKKGFGDLCWPVSGAKISSRFGKRWGQHHDGIDLNAAEGVPVLAAAAGTVILAKRNHAGYGNLIIISHENGYFTVYAHNRRNLVKKNQRISRCQQIAELGKTGRVTGPHLHFEVREGKNPRNPLLFLEP